MIELLRKPYLIERLPDKQPAYIIEPLIFYPVIKPQGQPQRISKQRSA